MASIWSSNPLQKVFGRVYPIISREDEVVSLVFFFSFFFCFTPNSNISGTWFPVDDRKEETGGRNCGGKLFHELSIWMLCWNTPRFWLSFQTKDDIGKEIVIMANRKGGLPRKTRIATWCFIGALPKYWIFLGWTPHLGWLPSKGHAVTFTFCKDLQGLY